MRGPVRHVRRRRPRAGKGVRLARVLLRAHRDDGGAAAVEFALLTTFAASVAFGTVALIGAEVDQPLEGLTSVLSVLAETNG